jgi:hypothetical protein
MASFVTVEEDGLIKKWLIGEAETQQVTNAVNFQDSKSNEQHVFLYTKEGAGVLKKKVRWRIYKFFVSSFNTWIHRRIYSR